MNKVLLIEEQDSSISVLIPSNEEDLYSLSKEFAKSKIVDSAFLPKDREFRDAWNIDGEIDLNKAKEIWRQKIRVVRDKKLKELDIKWMKAMERGDINIASAIASNKQTLRNLPDREEIRRAETLDELKQFWPSILLTA
jgi:hypothetical protein